MHTNKRIKVAFVINDFSVGGAQRLMADVLRRIDPQKFDVSLVTLMRFPHKATMEHLLPSGTSHYALDMKGFFDVLEWLRVRKTLRGIRPDVVVSNLFFSNTITRLLASTIGYRVVVVEHNTYVRKRWWERWMDRLLSRSTRAIVAVSETVAEFTSTQENIPRNKFIVIENGIDIHAIQTFLSQHSKKEWRRVLNLPVERSYIVSVARLTSQKDHALTLAGFAQFARNQPTYDLVLVGDGTLMAELKRRAAELGIGSRVHFMGARTDVFGFYAASDVFISTSEFEGFGIGHAEALAAGLPVVTTKTAGPDKMIHEGVNGFFINQRNAESVCTALERAIEHDPDRFSVQAKASVLRYDIAKTVAQYERVIDAAAGASAIVL